MEMAAAAALDRAILPVQGRPQGGLQPLLRQPVLLAEVGGDGPVNVVAAQPVVPGDGGDLDDVLKAVHDAHVQGAAAEVHDHHLAVAALGGVTVVQRCSGGLVNQPLHRHARQLGGQLSGAPLVVVEVGGHADHRLLHILTQIPPGILQQLAEHQGGQLLRLEPPAAQGKGLFRPHPYLKGGSSGLRMGHQPLLGRRPHQNGTVLQHAHGAAGLILSQLIGNQLHFAVSVDAGQRICCA